MADNLDTFVAPKYRSAGRRRSELNDRRASADAPLAVLRGLLSGVAGAPGDIESFVRMLPGLSEKTVLPTSEDVEKALPLRSVSETPVGRAMTGMGQIGGGFYTGPGSPLRAIAALPKAVSRAGKDFAVAAGQPSSNVIKPKGGNWLSGSVEGDLGNAGLYTSKSSADIARALGTDYTPELALKLQQSDPSMYMTLDEIRNLLSKDSGFAQGGVVNSIDSGYNADKVGSLANQLYTELMAQ